MKVRLICFFLIIHIGAFAQYHQYFHFVDSVFKNNVENGLVDYKAMKPFYAEIKQVQENAGKDIFPILNYNEKKTFLINFYNLAVIQTVLEKYPFTSVTEVANFFNSSKHILGNEKVSLNQIEKQFLFKEFPDNRLHFVLNCGAISCPKLQSFAFFAPLLESQLNQATRDAMNDSSIVKFSGETKKIELSKIFEWYESDFGNCKSKIEFVNAHSNHKIETDYSCKSMEYNWQLNDKTPFYKITTLQLRYNNVITYTPSRILPKNGYDINFFNSVYTQTESNWMGNTFSDSRETFYSSFIQFLKGGKKIAYGFDLFYRQSHKDVPNSSFTKVFTLGNNANHRAAFTYFGPKIKFAPFPKLKSFSVQSSLLVPTNFYSEGAKTFDGKSDSLYFADWSRISFVNQLFSDHQFGSYQLFVETDLHFRIKTQAWQSTALDVPTSVFLSRFFRNKYTVYSMLQYMQRVQLKKNLEDGLSSAAHYAQIGIGAKYQLNHFLQAEVFASQFFLNQNSGKGRTINIGLRYVRK